MIFGHSQGFIKNCSPWLSSLWAQMVLSEDMFSFRMETRGEQIIENACLYPITFNYIENHGELILKKCLLCPTPEYLWGTIMKNTLLCPNAMPGSRHYKYDGKQFNKLAGTDLEQAAREYMMKEKGLDQYESTHDLAVWPSRPAWMEERTFGLDTEFILHLPKPFFNRHTHKTGP
jgi:hypothetical protein